jgi:hypothetical protein
MIPLLACNSYDGLTPIRTVIDKTPDNPDFASFQERIKYSPKKINQTYNTTEALTSAPKGVLFCTRGEDDDQKSGLFFNDFDCLKLTNWYDCTSLAGKRLVLVTRCESLNPHPSTKRTSLHNGTKTRHPSQICQILSKYGNL